MGEPLTPEREPALDVGERVRLMRQGMVNYTSTLVSMLLGLVLVPIMLDGLGAQQYGVWVAATAVALTVGSLDLGLGSVVMREVAATDATPAGEEARVVRAAGKGYLGFGLVGGVVVGLAGIPLSHGLGLPPPTVDTAQAAFALGGVGLVGDQLLLYAGAVLGGLRRFGTVNAVTIALVTARFAGIVVLLAQGAGLVAVMAWQAVASVAVAWFALRLLATRAAPFRLKVCEPWDLRALRSRLSFGMGSVLATFAGALTWQVAPLLVGLVAGSPALAAYQVSQRIPLAVSGVANRLSTVLFPLASRYERSGDLDASRALVAAGTRWVVLVVLPLAVLLWPLADAILQAWLQDGSGSSATIFRLAIVAVLADAVGISAVQVLWGRGAIEVVVKVLGGAALVNLAGGLALLHAVGPVGAAWALAGATAAGAAVLLWAMTRELQAPPGAFLAASTGGVLLPTGACAAIAFGLTALLTPDDWLGIGTIAVLAVGAYVVVLMARGARPEERTLVAPLLGTVKRRLRSPYYLWLELRRAVADTPEAAERAYETEFRASPDPWRYRTASRERDRYRVALEHVRGTAPEGGFRETLEVGCAEGAFTELLAPHTRSLLAVDIATTALERAAQNCRAHPNVRFRRWDLRRDAPIGEFSLVVIMDVLDCFYRPPDLKAAVDKLVASIEPGGFLLLSAKLQSQTLETAFWTRWLVRGGAGITAFVGRHPSLDALASERSEEHIVTIFRRRP